MDLAQSGAMRCRRLTKCFPPNGAAYHAPPASSQSLSRERGSDYDDEESREPSRLIFGITPPLLFRFALLGRLAFLRGLLRHFRARGRCSERPMAIACLRLFTFLPERPLFSVPDLRFFIARPTLADAFFEYFLAMAAVSPVTRELIFANEDGSTSARRKHLSAHRKMILFSRHEHHGLLYRDPRLLVAAAARRGCPVQARA